VTSVFITFWQSWRHSKHHSLRTRTTCRRVKINGWKNTRKLELDLSDLQTPALQPFHPLLRPPTVNTIGFFPPRMTTLNGSKIQVGKLPVRSQSSRILHMCRRIVPSRSAPTGAVYAGTYHLKASTNSQTVTCSNGPKAAVLSRSLWPKHRYFRTHLYPRSIVEV
jgi:hypothetical protein